MAFAHRFLAPGDREVVALIAALLAFGHVKAIQTAIARVLAVLGPRPAATIASIEEAVLAERLSGFVHRVYRGQDVARVLAGAAALRREHGSLAHALVVLGARDEVEVPAPLLSRTRLYRTLAHFGDALRGSGPQSRGLVHLVPDVRRGSACKRLLLYLRWMARPADGVDLGLAAFPTSELVIPLDTHVHRIARNLQLTERADASLRTAVEVTESLARLDADDPVKYDFALCHLGISGECPSRRDPSLCRACRLRQICRHWR